MKYHDSFTMSYRQSVDAGIKYTDYPKVDLLPAGIQLTAVAGIWGDYMNIRCLFHDSVGNLYRRHIVRTRDGYIIRELGVDAKSVLSGTRYQVV